LIKKYSDITKESWKDVWGVDIYQFFNIISFGVEFDRKQAKAIEEWKRKH